MMETQVANVRVRASGTLGGNLCFAEPHSDPATLLTALGAKAHVQGRAGDRTVGDRQTHHRRLRNFTRGRRIARRCRDSSVKQIPTRSLSKIPAQRATDSRPSVSARCRRRHDQESDRRRRQRERRADAVGQSQQLLSGSREQVEKQLADAGETLAQAADPVDDLEGGADYKRHLIGVFLRRAFIKALS